MRMRSWITGVALCGFGLTTGASASADEGAAKSASPTELKDTAKKAPPEDKSPAKKTPAKKKKPNSKGISTEPVP